jgi:hypothetical protein
MSNYSSFTITVPVHIPVTKEIFDAWKNLDGYQYYLLEDFDNFIYEALSKSFSRQQMNNYIKTAVIHAQASIDEIVEADQEV